jgi:hypothetical protein
MPALGALGFIIRKRTFNDRRLLRDLAVTSKTFSPTGTAMPDVERSLEMRRRSIFLAMFVVAVGLLGLNTASANLSSTMEEGRPAIQSAGPLAFGPDGILFVADTKSAAIFAIATGDTKAAASSRPMKIEGINQKVAALLGTAADQILIDDLAVNPISHVTYLAVSRGRGPEAVPVLIKVHPDARIEAFATEKVKFSRADLPDAPADVAAAAGARPGAGGRRESITDLAYLDGRLLVAGLSNEEFGSTLRAIPFPFKSVSNGTSVEIYHGAHGRFETRAPVRTFVPFKVGNEDRLLAAYTCTPLVQFPLSELKPGAKIKGRTVAELGNRNRPLDMLVYDKDGQTYLLMANNSRGVMKISTADLDRVESIVGAGS